jgi:hypothetical protein
VNAGALNAPQGGYREEVRQYATAAAQAHPAVHQLTEVADIDQVLLERVDTPP